MPNSHEERFGCVLDVRIGAVGVFRYACNRSIHVGHPTAPDGERGGGDKGARRAIAPPFWTTTIFAAAVEGSDDSGGANLDNVGRRILATMPDFAPRSCGRRHLDTMAGLSGGFEIGRGSSSAMRIRPGVAKRKAASDA